MMDKNELGKKNQIDGSSSGVRGVSPIFIGWLVILAVAVIFFFRNGEETELDFLFMTTQNKTRWLVITCIAIGIVLDRLFTMWWRKRRRQKALRDG